MKHLVFGIALCFFCNLSIAQSLSSQVIASSGYYIETPVGSLSSTVGEHMGNNFSAANFLVLHQGFQSPATPKAIVIGLGEEQYGFKVYPNPVVDHLFIDKSNEIKSYSLQVLDVAGRPIIHQLNVVESSNEVNMSHLAAGIYFLIIRDPLGNSRSLSILKTK